MGAEGDCLYAAVACARSCEAHYTNVVIRSCILALRARSRAWACIPPLVGDSAVGTGSLDVGLGLLTGTLFEVGRATVFES